MPKLTLTSAERTMLTEIRDAVGTALVQADRAHLKVFQAHSSRTEAQHLIAHELEHTEEILESLLTRLNSALGVS